MDLYQYIKCAMIMSAHTASRLPEEEVLDRVASILYRAANVARKVHIYFTRCSAPPGGNDGNLPWLLEPLALDPGGANCCCLAEGLGEFAGESLLLRLPPLAGEASLAGDGDGALPGEGGALGLFLTFAQIGMCLSATAESKRRPQCGHGTIPSGALRAGEA